LFYGSFDAVTLLASIYILFPYENAEFREIAIQHCHWTVERFAAMKDMNPLAKSALGVLRAVVARLVKAVGNCAPSSSVSPPVDLRHNSNTTTPTSTSKTFGSTPTSSVGIGSVEGSFKGPSDSVSSGPAIPSTAEDSTAGIPSMMPGGWGMPQDGNGYTSMAPFFAMGDLIYKDLTVDQIDNAPPQTDSDPLLLGGDSFMWQFEGGFGEDTVWQFLNQHQPSGNETG
jgi:hypothetical protein